MAYTDYQGLPRANFIRRVSAMVYDALMVISIMMLAGGVGVGFSYLAVSQGWLNMGDATDIGLYTGQQLWFQLWIWGWAALFYLYFWTRSGQTIGMRAWRLRVQNTDGSPISAMQGIIRLATAILGLGNLLVLFSRQGMAFQDHWANCEMVLLSKEQNRQLMAKQRI